MFHVELAPLGGIFGPLKSDLGVFWPFRGTDFIMGKNKNANFSKSPHGPIFNFFVVIREVILQKMAPILALVNFFSFLTLIGNCGDRSPIWFGFFITYFRKYLKRSRGFFRGNRGWLPKDYFVGNGLCREFLVSLSSFLVNIMRPCHTRLAWQLVNSDPVMSAMKCFDRDTQSFFLMIKSIISFFSLDRYIYFEPKKPSTSI